VRHGENGLLAAPHDIAAIAGHLAELLADADRRRHMGANARVTVEAGFDARVAAGRMAVLLGAASRIDTRAGGTRCR